MAEDDELRTVAHHFSSIQELRSRTEISRLHILYRNNNKRDFFIQPTSSCVPEDIVATKIHTDARNDQTMEHKATTHHYRAHH